MPKTLDLTTWARKSHFDFFRTFEEPFFGLCVEVDCTTAYRKAKELNTSFFLYYLYQSVKAVNETEPFRYRIVGDEVLIHDQVGASATINRENGTFGFSYIPYAETFQEFERGAQAEIERVRSTDGLVPSAAAENAIHYSSLPWVRFTSLSHARSFSHADSIPKISFGKMTEVDGKKLMPLSIHVHHALMDGYHVGQHIDLFQELLNQG
ncbi:MAG: chloramphenicol acetyltransferase [Cyclobacteriaceae bacterium]